VAYPECEGYMAGNDPHGLAKVKADVNGTPVELAAAFGSVFGAAFWLALALHAIGIEVYVSQRPKSCLRFSFSVAHQLNSSKQLHLTPAEFERLRNISYQRQIEAGMKNPGAAGLTVDRFGDSEKWEPRGEAFHAHGRSPLPQEEPTVYDGAAVPFRTDGSKYDSPRDL